MEPRDYPGFWQVVTGEGRFPCWIATRWGWPGDIDSNHERALRLWACDGGIDACHLIPKQRIKKLYRHKPEVIFDPRVGVPGCRKHHSLLDNGAIKIKRQHLPACVEEYAEQYGLGWSLDRDYGELSGKER